MMQLLVVVLSVLSVARTHKPGFGCPLGFIHHGSSCYLFSHDTATFAEASAFCQFLSSHLASIGDSKEAAFLKGYLLSNGGGSHYYIGGTDTRLEGIWTWENPIRKIIYTDWYPEEPNGIEKQNCLELYPGNFRYRWNDISCSTKYRFICEKPL